MRRSLLLIAVLLLAGCGGSDKPPPAATPTASPTPEVTAEATPDPQAAIDKEIAAYRAMSGRKANALFYKVDGLALTLGTRRLKADSRRLDRLGDESGAPDGGFRSDFTAFNRRIQRQEWATMLPIWKRYLVRLEKVKARGTGASTRDFQLEEWKRSVAPMREFLSRLRGAPNADATREGFYQSLVYGQDPRVPVVIGYAFRKRQRAIARLKRADRVGDAYRKLILGAFVSPLKQRAKHREQGVSGQLWLLHRLREVENTPDAEYEAARMAIAGQSLLDARNPYARLREIGLELREAQIGSDGKELRNLRRLREWGLEQLEQPVPVLLEPTRKQLTGVFERMDVRGVREDDEISAVGDFFDRYIRAGKKVEKILLRGARAVDSPKRLRADIVAAVAATRPD